MRAALVSSSRWLAIALALAIPFSTALDNVLMAALVLSVLARNAGDVLQAIRHNPVARASVLLFAMLVVGLAYGQASLATGLGILGKYADLAVTPLMLVALRDGATRRRAMQAFLGGMTVTAVISWLVGLQIVPAASWMWAASLPEGAASNPAIFRSSITQNILMAYAMYLALLWARDAATARGRALLAALAVLMAGDVLFMVNGRTGYIILLVLLLVFGWHASQGWLHARGKRLDWRVPAALALLLPVLVFAVYAGVPRLHDRIDEAAAEYHAWHPGVPTDSSIGSRLEFYYNTWALIAHHPLAGVGTGGFEQAYAARVAGTGVSPTHNPHDEFLLIAVQVGVLGLALLLYLLYAQWRCAARLPTARERQAARGLMLTLAISALFNSVLFDHTEGVFFAYMNAFWFAGLGEEGQHA